MGISSVIAQLRTAELKEFIRSYTQEIGLALEFQYENFYAGIRAGDQVFDLKHVDGKDPSIKFVDDGEHFHLYFGTDDVEAAAAALKRRGILFTKNVHEPPWERVRHKGQSRAYVVLRWEPIGRGCHRAGRGVSHRGH